MRSLTVALIGALTTALALGGCASGEGDRSAASDRAPRDVVISTGGNYLANYASLWAAHPEFSAIEKDFGTTISFSTFTKGSDALAAMLGGSAQICNCGPTTALTAATAGKSVKYIGNISMGSGQLLIAAKKFEGDRAGNVAAFKGSTVGFTSPGSLSQITAKKVVESAGLSWPDMNQISLGSNTAFAPALETGRIDLAVMDIPTAVAVVDKGIGYVVADLNDPVPAQPLVGQIIGTGLVAPAEFTDEYPELSQAIVTALVQGLNKVRGARDAAAAYALMPDAFTQANPQKDFADQWTYLYSSFADADGAVTPKAVADTVQLAGLPETSVPQGFFDNGFVDKAYGTTGLQRPAPAGSTGS